MIIIPAIDIKDGKCVRLAQGDFDRVTIYADDPVLTAAAWARKGAGLIHVVDLDGSVAGLPKNAQIILKIAKEVNVPIQAGGGIRDIETIDFYLQNGVGAVILGTTALQNEEIIFQAGKKYPGRIILGIDALDGNVAVQGWTQKTQKSLMEDLFQISSFFKGGGKWLTAEQLSRQGMEEIFKKFPGFTC